MTLPSSRPAVWSSALAEVRPQPTVPIRLHAIANVPLGPKLISAATLGIVAWYIFVFRFLFFLSFR